MLMLNKETNVIDNVAQLPSILALNSGGEAMDWITYERCAFYKAKNKILWSMGSYEVKLRGGTNAMTGQQSILTLDTIVAIDYDKSPTKHRRATPTLTNKTLFHRDRFVCAYCGSTYKHSELTRDHIIPTSKGGADNWTNVITACKGCNQYKSDRTPEQADMPLLFVPYTPNFEEVLILQNRRILADQMDFLMKRVSKHSRLHS